MAAEDHGDSCASSPLDHYCGASAKTDEPDQGVSWQVLWHLHGAKMAAIRALHEQGVTDDGGVTGYCEECSIVWPCPTYHLAYGWDPDEDTDDWCPHTRRRI